MQILKILMGADHLDLYCTFAEYLANNALPIDNLVINVV